MTVHIFNPEHDIALAANLSNFTAPHAGRQLRHDLGFLPALWAKEDDVVLVDDVELARRSYSRLVQAGRKYLGGVWMEQTPGLLRPNCQFAPSKLPVCSVQTASLEPWGWDLALKARLKRAGVSESLLPSDAEIGHIRELSHRRTAAGLLPKLQCEGAVGISHECFCADEVDRLLHRYGKVVLKAPWSSSGRGLRFLDVERTPLQMQAGWLRNVLKLQGSVMVEPFYIKVKDLGMEFTRSTDGTIRYDGLSLFHTTNGAYTGNIVATENRKREMISRYISITLLNDIRQKIIDKADLGGYHGPFGVDMMIVRGEGELSDRHSDLLLHPCVEINLRRTMGHAALSLTPSDDDVVRVMRIVYADNVYKLKLQAVRHL